MVKRQRRRNESNFHQKLTKKVVAGVDSRITIRN